MVLWCGSLITAVEDVGDYLFVEPKFMQDGVVDIRSGDVIANLPYHPNCTLWFDHHFTNNAHGFDEPIVPGRGGFRLAPSAARVVFEYYSQVSSSSNESHPVRTSSSGVSSARVALATPACVTSPWYVLSPWAKALFSRKASSSPLSASSSP